MRKSCRASGSFATDDLSELSDWAGSEQALVDVALLIAGDPVPGVRQRVLVAGACGWRVALLAQLSRVHGDAQEDSNIPARLAFNCCQNVASGFGRNREGAGPEKHETPLRSGVHSAPRETRTPTDHTVHKALNLARLPIPPQARDTAIIGTKRWPP